MIAFLYMPRPATGKVRTRSTVTRWTAEELEDVKRKAKARHRGKIEPLIREAVAKLKVPPSPRS